MAPRTLKQKLRTLARSPLGTIEPFSQAEEADELMDFVGSSYENVGVDDELSDFDAWRNGLCYGLAMMYLFSARAGNDRRVLQELRAEVRAFKERNPNRGATIGSGMLEYLAHLHTMGSRDVSLVKHRALNLPDKAKRLLGRRPQDDDETGTDVLMRENGFKKWPDESGKHRRDFTIELPSLETRQGSRYGREALAEEVREMVAFFAKPRAYSRVRFFHTQWRKGHTMAAVGRTHGCSFFDPNFGVVTFPLNSLMTGFLRRALPYVYFYKPPRGVRKDPLTMPAKLSSDEISVSSLIVTVERYR